LQEHSEGYDIVIPFFLPSSDEEAQKLKNDDELLEERPELEDTSEFIKLHCLTLDDEGHIDAHHSPSPFGLSW
jgi:hypothetical protein